MPKLRLAGVSSSCNGAKPVGSPGDSPMPEAIDVPENAAGQIVWLTLPMAASNAREVDDREGASRFSVGPETLIDSTSALRIEEEIDLAHPRLRFEVRKTPKPGFHNLGVARIVEVVRMDRRCNPPVRRLQRHMAKAEWLAG